MKDIINIFSGEHCRTFTLLFSPQICSNVKKIIENLEQYLQATNGIAADYIFIRAPFTKKNINTDRSYVVK